MGMTPKELAAYRLQLIRDASGMQKKPDRIPNISFFVTWKILDAGYKLTEAMNDYDIMEKVVRRHMEVYHFDQIFDVGIRNAYRVSQAMKSSSYVINDEAEVVSYKDFAYCKPEETEQFAANYYKYLWEVGMPRKFSWWGKDADLSTIQNAYNEQNKFFNFAFHIKNVLRDELGIPFNGAPNPYAAISMETVLAYVFGMRGVAVMMRRDKARLHAVLDALDELFFTPQLEQLKKIDGPNPDYCFDYIAALLAHNFMSPAQWEEFYWPYLKKVLDVLAEKKCNCALFMEGAMLRFADYFKDYPKGLITILPEQDDVFELRKTLPNVAILGGMKNALLGRGTRQECLDLAKRLIDELGADGGYMFSQDKMGSYRNDANPENLKAVCDFVLEYTPSQH